MGEVEGLGAKSNGRPAVWGSSGPRIGYAQAFDLRSARMRGSRIAQAEMHSASPPSPMAPLRHLALFMGLTTATMRTAAQAGRDAAEGRAPAPFTVVLPAGAQSVGSLARQEFPAPSCQRNSINRMPTALCTPFRRCRCNMGGALCARRLVAGSPHSAAPERSRGGSRTQHERTNGQVLCGGRNQWGDGVAAARPAQPGAGSVCGG